MNMIKNNLYKNINLFYNKIKIDKHKKLILNNNIFNFQYNNFFIAKYNKKI